MNKKLLNKIIKICGTPEDFCFDYIGHGASQEANIRRMKEYVSCVRKVERVFKKIDSEVRCCACSKNYTKGGLAGRDGNCKCYCH